MNKKQKKKMNKNIEQKIYCPYCGGKAKLVKASFVYGKQALKPDEFLYVCSNYGKGCDAYVTTYEGTKEPKGFLANADLRNKRIIAHQYINQIVSAGIMSKNQIYKYLNINVPYSDGIFHIGTSNHFQCDMAIREMQKIIQNNKWKVQKQNIG